MNFTSFYKQGASCGLNYLFTVIKQLYLMETNALRGFNIVHKPNLYQLKNNRLNKMRGFRNAGIL